MSFLQPVSRGGVVEERGEEGDSRKGTECAKVLSGKEHPGRN